MKKLVWEVPHSRHYSRRNCDVRISMQNCQGRKDRKRPHVTFYGDSATKITNNGYITFAVDDENKRIYFARAKDNTTGFKLSAPSVTGNTGVWLYAVPYDYEGSYKLEYDTEERLHYISKANLLMNEN